VKKTSAYIYRSSEFDGKIYVKVTKLPPKHTSHIANRCADAQRNWRWETYISARRLPDQVDVDQVFKWAWAEWPRVVESAAKIRLA